MEEVLGGDCLSSFGFELVSVMTVKIAHAVTTLAAFKCMTSSAGLGYEYIIGYKTQCSLMIFSSVFTTKKDKLSCLCNVIVKLA